MSSQQLFHHDLVQNLRLIIGRETLPKGALRLEIAESLINSNPEQAIEILDWLKSLNVSIALDEFGVSFSSLSYWHRLSIDAIKIDRSLVTLGGKERPSGMVLKAVLMIAHELGKDVVAVGVDSEQDLAYVRALGCDFGQGFFYSELLTEREVITLLNAIARSERHGNREQEREAKRVERRAGKEKEKEDQERQMALSFAGTGPAEAAQATPEAGPRGNGKRRPRPGRESRSARDAGSIRADAMRAGVPGPQGALPPLSGAGAGTSPLPFSRGEKP